MRKKRIIEIVIVVIAVIALVGCSSQQRFGQRKAPKNCNTCTKWGK